MICAETERCSLSAIDFSGSHRTTGSLTDTDRRGMARLGGISKLFMMFYVYKSIIKKYIFQRIQRYCSAWLIHCLVRPSDTGIVPGLRNSGRGRAHRCGQFDGVGDFFIVSGAGRPCSTVAELVGAFLHSILIAGLLCLYRTRTILRGVISDGHRRGRTTNM